MKNKFGHRNKKEKIIFAEEAFRVHIQCELYKLIKKNKWSLNKFAAKMEMDQSTINQIFESDFYTDIMVLAKMFYILGVEPRFIFEEI